MLSHQGEFSWVIPRRDPISILHHFGAHLSVGARPTRAFGAKLTLYAIASAVCFCAATIASAMKVATRLTNFSLLLLGV